MSDRPVPSSPLEYASDGSTLVEVTDAFGRSGYTSTMLVRDGGLLCRSCGTPNEPERYAVHCVRRTEGASDPADMAAVYGLECPSCGARGTLTLKFGPGTGAEEADVLRRLPDDRKGRPTDTAV